MPDNQTIDDEQPSYASMLERMKEERVFSIERDGENFMVVEECDRYFGEMLTRYELRQLAIEIMAIAEKTNNA